MENEKCLDSATALVANSVDELKDMMVKNQAEAKKLRDYAINLGCQNEQFVIDWQDELNDVSNLI